MMPFGLPVGKPSAYQADEAYVFMRYAHEDADATGALDDDVFESRIVQFDSTYTRTHY